jgi:hypothetical protein
MHTFPNPCARAARALEILPPSWPPFSLPRPSAGPPPRPRSRPRSSPASPPTLSPFTARQSPWSGHDRLLRIRSHHQLRSKRQRHSFSERQQPLPGGQPAPPAKHRRAVSKLCLLPPTFILHPSNFILRRTRPQSQKSSFRLLHALGESVSRSDPERRRTGHLRIPPTFRIPNSECRICSPAVSQDANLHLGKQKRRWSRILAFTGLKIPSPPSNQRRSFNNPTNPTNQPSPSPRRTLSTLCYGDPEQRTNSSFAPIITEAAVRTGDQHRPLAHQRRPRHPSERRRNLAVYRLRRTPQIRLLERLTHGQKNQAGLY